MKYALFDYYHGPNHPRKFAEHIEQWAFADGFMNYAFVAEHHFDGDFACCPSPGPLLGAVSQVTSRMRIGALGFVVPLWNPVRLSEEILFLHDATKGRLELGFVSGINDPAFEHYGVEWDTKGELFWQLADAVVEKIDGKVKTIWFPSRDKNSIERAAVRGWSTAQWVQPKLDVVRTLFHHHRGYVTQAKKPDADYGILREVYVGETTDEAKRIGGEAWLKFWSRIHRTKLKENIGTPRAERWREMMSIEQSISDCSFICGTPEEVKRQIDYLTILTGATVFMADFAFGDLSQERIIRSMNLFKGAISDRGHSPLADVAGNWTSPQAR